MRRQERNKERVRGGEAHIDDDAAAEAVPVEKLAWAVDNFARIAAWEAAISASADASDAPSRNVGPRSAASAAA